MSTSLTTFPIKLLLIGDSGVGKSALLMRYADDMFTNSFITTIGMDMRMKHIKMGGGDKKIPIDERSENENEVYDLQGVSTSENGCNLLVTVWDTAGQERFRTITTAYYRNVDGVILVYDTTKPETLNSLTSWIQDISKYSEEKTQYIVIGTKIDSATEDMKNPRALADVLDSIESFTDLGEKTERTDSGRTGKIDHILCSSKTGENVDKAFDIITKKIYNVMKRERDGELKRSIIITDEESKKGSCC